MNQNFKEEKNEDNIKASIADSIADSMIEITLEQWDALKETDILLIDIRDSVSYQHGFITGAINIPREELLANPDILSHDKKIILYCMKGILSRDLAETLREKGYDAYDLYEGYAGWIVWMMKKEKEKDLFLRVEEIEKSLRKKFHKDLFGRFAKAVNQYDLIQEDDKIAVCISGGKDSMLMAKLFQELKRHNKFPFELEFLVMDPGYSETNRQVIEDNAKLMGIPVTIFDSPIFDAVFEIENSPCYLCARMRRGYLYSKAKELGCNKIALGHHYDDVIETILMGMLYSGQVQTMMPKLHSTNFEGMELIRPMYLIREDDIKHWRDYNHLHFIQCACRFTDNCSINPDEKTDNRTGSKRIEIKNLIRDMKKVNSYVEGNIFKSVENVNLDTVVGYKKKGVRHSFLEEY